MFVRRLVAGLFAVPVLLVAGCGSDEPSTKPTDTPASATTPTVVASAAAGRDALAAYRSMWNAFVEAAKTSDPDAPDVRKFASDQALKLIVSSLQTNKQLGKVTKGDLVLNPTVTEVKPAATPTEVAVLDCVDSTNWLEYKASGGLWDNLPGGKHQTTATVTLTDGAWKVSSFTLKESGTC